MVAAGNFATPTTLLGLERKDVLDTGSPLVTSFVFGSAELYEWVHENPGSPSCAPSGPTTRRSSPSSR